MKKEQKEMLARVEQFLAKKHGIEIISTDHRLAYAIMAVFDSKRYETIYDFADATNFIALDFGVRLTRDALIRSLYRTIKRLYGPDSHDLWAVCTELAQEFEAQK